MPYVLIVEDDADTREMLDMALTTSGYQTMTAQHGGVALDRMRERRPCVVLLDLMMPVMDGFQFRAEQLADPTLADVPVIAVSAICSRNPQAHALGIPCLKKPVQFDVLFNHVEQACRRSPNLT
jgi:DNA-binding response OmpR family regulator